jgi:hypothetical protein
VKRLKDLETEDSRLRRATADLTLAMGMGTDVAMEIAGATLLKGDLIGIGARRLSHSVCATYDKTSSSPSFTMLVSLNVIGDGVRLRSARL